MAHFKFLMSQMLSLQDELESWEDAGKTELEIIWGSNDQLQLTAGQFRYVLTDQEHQVTDCHHSLADGDFTGEVPHTLSVNLVEFLGVVIQFLSDALGPWPEWEFHDSDEGSEDEESSILINMCD